MERLALIQGLEFRRAEMAARVRDSGFQKILRISAVSAGVVLLSGFVMFNLRSPTVPKTKADSVSVAAMASSSSSTTTAPMIGINIANNGSVVVRGARVTAVYDNVIAVEVSWGSADFAWVVETSLVTKFLNNQGRKQVISDIMVGDIVTVTGKLTKNDSRLVIDAGFVREH